MRPERWRQAQSLFDQALDEPAQRREAFLRERCGSDAALLEDVLSLLDADAAAEAGFLETTVQRGAQLFDEANRPAAGRRVFGKYEIVRRLAEGGFGEVFEAWDPVLKRQVALKVCTSADRDLRKRFFREAEISAGLQHPNIVTVHDLGVADGIPFLVQELLPGEDLSDLVARRDPLPLEERLQLLRQIGRGLVYAHEQGVLHRDVKPANVRILEGHRVKILDFGIARLVDEDSQLTTAGSTMGTVAYLAPEQLGGGAPDVRSDIFAFGVLAYELLAYRRPFEGGTFSQVSYQLLYREPERLRAVWPACPPALDRLLRRCLAKKPQHRYASMAEVLEELEAIRSRIGPGLAASPPAIGSAGSGSGWRNRWRWAAAVGGLLAALALVFALVGTPWGHQTPPDPGARTSPVIRTASLALQGDDPPREPVEGGAEDSPDEQDPETESATGPSEDEATDEQAEDRPRDGDESDEGEADASRRGDAAEGDRGEGAGEEADATRSASEPAPSGGRSEADGSEEPADEPSNFSPLIYSAEDEAVVQPVLLGRPEPVYPRQAQRRRQEATIVLAVLVDERGRVSRTVVVGKSDDPRLGFEDAALEAARRARFRPASREGRPGKMWTELVIEFRLP